MAHHDLCIVGTGSGNTILDERFDDLDVAIVEQDAFGGTCLNRGCIPTKMFVHPADVALAAATGTRLGVETTFDGVRWREIRDRIFGRIDPIAADGAVYRRGQPNVTVYEGSGRFVGLRRMAVSGGADDGAEITADRWVLAAGARADLPDVAGLDTVPFHTSDTVMRIDELPRRVVVLGGGFIGCEMAHVFSAFGAEVTLVTRGELLLSHHDVDIARRFTEVFRGRVDLRPRHHLRSVAEANGVITVELDHDEGGAAIECDLLLVATGRIPNSDLLDVASTGVRVDEAGFVLTDDTLQTDVEGIWALGDLRSPQMLKHVANHEARVVQHNLLHPRSPISVEERYIPHAVFTSPQVAAVGLTEADARALGHDVIVSTRAYGDTAYGWALDDTTSICKLVAERSSRRLLGAHLVGPEASILLQMLVQGMVAGSTVDELARGQMYPHPALTEVVEQALLGF